MRNTFITLLAFVLSIICSQMSVAQGTANVQGVILEEGTEEPLFGANAFIVGTSKGAATDVEGKFTIRGVPEGTYTIRISYLGYQTIEEEIEVVAGETLELNFTLAWAGVEGEEINITAQAQGQISAINEQLASNTISNVVSSARIKELPDVNAAESIGRLPGVSVQRSGGEANKVVIRGLSPKYNSVTVNGVSLPSSGGNDRSVDLSLVSSNVLDGIEVKKANTPDMDADALGGSVDLKIRDAQEGFHAQLSAQGGYNDLLSYYENYKVDGNVSNRFLDDKLGVIVTFNADQYNRSVDQFSAGYRTLSTTDGSGGLESIVTNLNLQENNVIRSRQGFSFVTDYRIPEGKITANAFFNQLKSDGIYYTNDLNIDGNRHYYNTSMGENTTSIFTGALNYEQDFGSFRLEAGISRSTSDSHSPQDMFWQFAHETGETRFDKNDSLYNSETKPTDIQALALVDTAETRLANFSLTERRTEENRNTAHFDVEVPYQIGTNIDGFVKFGGKFQILDRYNDIESFGRGGLQYGGAENALECADANLPESWDLMGILEENGYYTIDYAARQNYSRGNYLGGEYELGIYPRTSLLRELVINTYENCTGYGSDDTFQRQAITSEGDDYEGLERYQAAYVMTEMQLGNKVTLIPGIRWEGDYSKYDGQIFSELILNNIEQSPSDLTDTTSTRTNNFFLPMVHLIYEPTDWLKVRLARTETISRPDYIQYAPISRINSFRNYYRAANTGLVPSEAVNYDASISVYRNKIGFFTVSGFYKDIKNLIFQTPWRLDPNIEPPEGLLYYDKWLVTGDGTPTSANGDIYINNPNKANYVGVELDWQTSFWYLPSVFKGLVLNANYTYIQSEMDYLYYDFRVTDSVNVGRPSVPIWQYEYGAFDTSRTGRMPDQPTHVANVTLGYDYKGFSTRFSLLFQSDVSTYVDQRRPINDQFTGDYLRLDISARQKINEVVEVFANFNNINSRPDRAYRTSPDNSGRPTNAQFYGFTMDVGIRARF